MPADEDIVRLARGLQQANSRLTRVLSLLESRDPPGTAGALDALLDLLQAVDDAIATSGELGVRTGLQVARGAAWDALAQAGITPVPLEGVFDPTTQRAVAVIDAGAAHDAVLTTHKRGWVRSGDDEITPVRTALVTVQGRP